MSHATIKRISRRTMLRGAGVALALPWMESLLPRTARAQSTSAPRRYVALYFPNGTANFWKPSKPGEGNAWTLSPILEPLLPVKPYLSVYANVSNYAPFGGHVEPSHSNLGASTWTCVRPGGQNNDDNGISIDQVIAKQVGMKTPLASLQVGLSTLDSSTDGLPGQHSRSMSWKSASEPLYKLVNPQAVFDRLTASGAGSGGNMSGSDPAAERRRMLGRSVLDFVLEDAAGLQGKLGSSDRKKLDQFLTSVRSLEQRVADPTMQVARNTCMPVQRPSDVYGVGKVPQGYDRGHHAQLMIDLVVMAFACDLTRVVSFMLDDARSDFVYNFLNERKFSATGSVEGTAKVGGYHGLQHAGDNNNGFATIGWWNAQKAAELAGKLMAIQEADGNLLDNTVITFCSGMHSGNHDAGDVPLALIGGGGKTASGSVLKRDRYLSFGSEHHLADVHLTLLKHVFDGPDAKFGASKGVIGELLA